MGAHKVMLFGALAFIVGQAVAQSGVLSVQKSEVSFLSLAPLERIAAGSDQAAGVLDIEKRTFAIRVLMRSFNGFNSPLQQEHFNENYVESVKNPFASFEGRIIEACDLHVPGTYTVRAKGSFTVHGIPRERIIACIISVTKDGVRVNSDLDVSLAEYGIRIPRVVQQKIAAVVHVKVDLLFKRAAHP